MNWFRRLINVALMMANVNQFKQMAVSESWKAFVTGYHYGLGYQIVG